MRRVQALILGMAVALALPAPVSAIEYLFNGDFERGSYAGWQTHIQDGGSGTLYLSSGYVSPVSHIPIAPNRTGGQYYSVIDQRGPGSYSLTQSFTISYTERVHISFQMFVDTTAGIHVNGRDFTTGPNQNVVVDLLTERADAFTTDGSDIVAVLFSPSAAFRQPQPWSNYSFSQYLAPGTYQLRFAETDSQSIFQHGIDNASVATGSVVPEPASWVMMITGFGLIGAVSRRRNSAVAA